MIAVLPCFILCLLSNAVVYSTVLPSNVEPLDIVFRNLEEIDVDKQTVKVNKKTSAQASEISKNVRDTMKKLRGGTPQFYEKLLQALIIKSCDFKVKGTTSQNDNALPKPNIRFVNAGSIVAYKDSAGNCIRVSDPEREVSIEYSSGKCEVKPNCYWRPIKKGDKHRIPVYSTQEAKNVPPGNMTLPEADVTLNEWAKGITIFVAPGIILACLTVLTMILFLVCRCCCNKCGGRNPRPEGYSCTQKLLPLVFFVLFSGAIASCAGVSLLYNNQVTTAVRDVFNITDITLNDTKKWIVNVRTPLINVKNQVLLSVGDVRRELNGTDFIESGLGALTDKLDEFGSNTANVKLPRRCKSTDTVCVPCGVCTTISGRIKESSKQMDDLAGSGIKKLKEVRKTLNTKLVNIGDTIRNVVDKNVNTTETMIGTIEDTRLKIDDVEKTWDSTDMIREAGVLCMFLLALVVIAIGLLGILFGFTPLKILVNIIHIAYLIGFIALFISFLVAAIMIAVSVLLSDVCELTFIMSNDWTPVMGDSATGLNACFQNQSLLDAFNLSGSFEFADKLKFPAGMNTKEMMDFSTFYKFEGEIKNSTGGTFKIDRKVLDAYVGLLNGVTNKTISPCNPNDNNYTVNNSMTPWIANGGTNNGSINFSSNNKNATEYMIDRYTPFNGHCAKKCNMGQENCTYTVMVLEIWTNLTTIQRTLDQVEVDAHQFVLDMKKNMSNVGHFIGNFSSNITKLDSSITKIKNSLTSNLLKYIQDFKNGMYCTFLAVKFTAILNVMCGELMPAFTMISLMIFLMGVFLIAVNICLIIICKRLRSSSNGTIPSETEFK